MRARMLIVAVAAMLLAARAAQATQYAYTVTDLGDLGWGNTYANGLNDAGQVVGDSHTAGVSHLQHAFLYSNGAMTDLGTLGGSSSMAFGINDAGQVVGMARTTDNATHPFLYSNGVMTDLGTFGGTESRSLDINDAGQVVGYSYLAGNTVQHAFLYSNGVMTDLGTLFGGFSSATGINDVGQVAGWNTANGWHAFLYGDGAVTDLGTLGGQTVPEDINNAGQVVGWGYTSSGAWRPFLYSNGVMTVLGTLGGSISRAYGINDAGVVVGTSLTVRNTANDWRAFLYSDGVMKDLNTLIDPASHCTLESAEAINESGQIVGWGSGHAFLLTPVPEPASLSLLSLGGLAILRRRK